MRPQNELTGKIKMQIELHMVGHHRNSNITIKGVQFVNGKTMVYGADELVGNICRYLESYGAFQPHVAERKQAILDGEEGMLGIRAARRNLAKAEEQAATARKQIERAQELVEERMLSEQAAAHESTPSKDSTNVKMEDKSSSEGRSSESAPSGKGSKSSKSNSR